MPTPTRFEAVGLRYRFLAFDPADASASRCQRVNAQLGLSLRIRDIQRNGLPGRPRYSTNPFPTFFFLPSLYLY